MCQEEKSSVAKKSEEVNGRAPSRMASATIISVDASMTGQHDRRALRAKGEPHGT
jgi:hypothetical protein